MARKLPWTAGANANAVAARNEQSESRSRKRTRDTSISRHFTTSAQNNHSDEAEAGPSTAATPRITQTPSKHDARGSRTPSTSPPPAPPAIEFMREGWDADDGYVMVEDEFQAVAQGFTVGLHHAEYKRLKREARERGRKAGQSAGAASAAGLAGKRREVAERQRVGLGAITKVGEGVEEGSSDGSAEEREKKGVSKNTKKWKKDAADADVEDLWAGTKLAGLMASRSQEKTSLMGLGRLATSTRAALGYGPSGNGEGKKGRERVDMHDGEAARDRKSARESANEKPVNPRTKAEKADTQPAVQKEAKQSGSSLKGNAARSSTRKFIDDLDDFDGDAWDRRQAEESKQSRQEPESSEPFRPRKARPAKPKSRLDEVPVFLI